MDRYVLRDFDPRITLPTYSHLTGGKLLANPLAAHRQDLSPDRSAVREPAFLWARVFEGAWPHDHLPRHSCGVVAEGAARARLKGSRGEPSLNHGRPALGGDATTGRRTMCSR